MAQRRGPDRRQFVQATALVGLAAGCSRDPEVPVATIAAPVDAKLVRVASVKTAVEGALLPTLVKQFEATTSYRVLVTTGTQVYDEARIGRADLVISHFGHRDAERFVLDGQGEWPRTIFSNQIALIGPASDPAGIRNLSDLVAAFTRIAKTRSAYVVNDTDGIRYLTDLVWNASGTPDRTGWYVDPNLGKDAAIDYAAKHDAYVLWGLTPFLRMVGSKPVPLEPLVTDDPMLQRMMVSVVVKPDPSRAVNAVGALAFQDFLLAPPTQAAIRTVTYPGANDVHWVPAGRHNTAANLPKRTG